MIIKYQVRPFETEQPCDRLLRETMVAAVNVARQRFAGRQS
jgi:hypothetical protein